MGREAICPICQQQQVVPRESVLRAAREIPFDPRRPTKPQPSSWQEDDTPAQRTERPTSAAARTSLVLGLLSLVLGLLTGVPAVAFGIFALLHIQRRGSSLQGTRLAGWGIASGLIGIFIITPLMIGFTVAVLDEIAEDEVLSSLFGFQPSAPEMEDPELAHREASLDNLEDLAEALRGYARQHGHLPPAALTDPAGKPLLSWRVAILPYLNDPDATELYRAFKLDEPWDSPHNQKLLARMPDYFALPGRTTPPGTTCYQVLTGEQTAFEDPKGQRVEDFTDPLEDTFLIVEAETAVPWTKPVDLTWTPNGPLPDFGKHYEGGFHAAFVDGSVDFLPAWIDVATLRGLITRNGGENVLRP